VFPKKQKKKLPEKKNGSLYEKSNRTIRERKKQLGRGGKTNLEVQRTVSAGQGENKEGVPLGSHTELSWRPRTIKGQLEQQGG